MSAQEVAAIDPNRQGEMGGGSAAPLAGRSLGEGGEGDDTRLPQALDKTIRRKTLNAQRPTPNVQFRKSFMLLLPLMILILINAPSSLLPAPSSKLLA
jgi:hypothetical protein